MTGDRATRTGGETANGRFRGRVRRARRAVGSVLVPAIDRDVELWSAGVLLVAESAAREMASVDGATGYAARLRVLVVVLARERWRS